MALFDIFKRNKKNTQPVEWRSMGEVVNFEEVIKELTSGSGAQSALKLSAVHRCVDLIANTMAGLPIKVYEIDANGYKNEVHNDLSDIIAENPCYNMSRHDLIKSLMIDLLLHGNAYAYISRNANAQVNGIHYVPFANVTVIIPASLDKPLRYQVQGLKKTVEAVNMLHIKGLTLDGYVGIDPLKQMAQLLQIASASEKSASSWYSGGCAAGGVLNVQTPMTESQKKDLKRKIADNFNTKNGQPNSIMILEGAMSYTPINVNPESSQLLQSRLFNNQLICQFFGVNPVLIGDLTHSSYSTVEAVMLQFLQTCISNHINTIESELNRKVLTPSQRAHYRIDFQTDELLRADSNARASYFNTLYQIGALSSNEIRQALGKTAVEGGDVYLRPLNMTPQNNIQNVDEENHPQD